jgi:hypothetical protein
MTQPCLAKILQSFWTDWYSVLWNGTQFHSLYGYIQVGMKQGVKVGQTRAQRQDDFTGTSQRNYCKDNQSGTDFPLAGHLSRKHGSLFCHREISQTTVLHVKLLVSLESSWWVRVHQNLVLRLFGATVWKLLIIEHFFQWKLNKIEIENCIEIWGCSSSCVVGEPQRVRFNRVFISQFSELRCERYWFLSEFCCWKLKGIAKIGLGRKTQLSAQCVHIPKFRKREK